MTSSPYYKKVIYDEYCKRSERNPKFSLRAFAKSLGVPAGSLSQVLSLKRPPTVKFGLKIIDHLELNPKQRELFLSSIQGRKKTSKKLTIKTESQSTTAKDLDIEAYRVIADWYHSAILQLTFCEDTQSTPEWFAQRLGISVIEAESALERLFTLGLLVWRKGTLKAWTETYTTAQKNISTSALRKFQKQVLEKSIVALESEPIERRCHTVTTMAINPKNIEAARKLIDQFHSQMSKLLESGNRTEVYNFGIHLYKLTEKENP